MSNTHLGGAAEAVLLRDTEQVPGSSVMPLAGLWQERRLKPQFVSMSCHK